MANQADSVQTEEWRDIPGWEGLYQASSHGRIMSMGRTIDRSDRMGREYVRTYPAKILSLSTLPHGYQVVGLSDLSPGRSKKLYYVHRLVAAAFHGRPPEGDIEAAHLNGTRADNRPDNLEWQTVQQNAAGRIGHGTQSHGSAVSSKLTEESARAIWRRYAEIKNSYRVAAEFGVNASTVQRIVNGTYWSRAIGQKKQADDH